MDNLVKARLSLAYISAVCARAGFEVHETKVDIDSVDGLVRSSRGKCPVLAFQAKSTSRGVLRETTVWHDLSKKNYDDLRRPRSTATILIVVCLPEQDMEWLVQDESSLAMRRAGYWMSLSGLRESANTSTVRVELPRSQIFDVRAVEDIMARIDVNPMI